MDERIIPRIKKLLNMADAGKNSNEEEASTAMLLAQKLLRKHHMSMSQVMELGTEGSGSSDFFEIREEEAVAFKANLVPKWMLQTIKTTNRVTSTKTLINRTPRPESMCADMRIVFVGDAVDVIAAAELFNYLRTTISKLSSKHQKSVNGKFKQWRSFAEGCSDKLLVRAEELDSQLNSQINNLFGLRGDDRFDLDNFELDDDDEYEVLDDLDEDLKDEHALVLYNQYKETKFEKIMDYISDKDVESEKSSSTSSRIDYESFEMGSEAGEDIPLSVAKKLTRRS